MTPKQVWWVTFWAAKESMKGGLYKTLAWQLESLMKQLKEITDGNEI